MYVSNINTTHITLAQINRVYPVTLGTSQEKVIFAVQTDQVNDDGELVDCRVEWNGERFVGSCGDCEHILWVIAFLRENKLEDYLDEETTYEVTERLESAKFNAIFFRVADAQGTELVTANLLSSLAEAQALPEEKRNQMVLTEGHYYFCHCSKFWACEYWYAAQCDHTQAARAFEQQFADELSHYYTSITESVEQIAQATSELAEK